MKASELRIGNILQYFIGEDDCEWDSTVIDWQDLKWATEENENFNKVHKPIPLTEEWFLKLVKKSDWGKQMYGQRKIYQHQVFKAIKLEWIPSNQVVVYFNDEVINYKDYVHQLMNLFYALTGEELTLTDQG